MLAQVIDAEKPDHLGVAFDVKGGTFRNEMLPQYKGTREAAPEELLTQLPLIQRMLTALGVTYIEKRDSKARRDRHPRHHGRQGRLPHTGIVR